MRATTTSATLQKTTMTPWIIETPRVKNLRAYATRLMAFALKAVGDGDMGFAGRLAARASECLDHARATEGLAADRRRRSSSK